MIVVTLHDIRQASLQKHEILRSINIEVDCGIERALADQRAPGAPKLLQPIYLAGNVGKNAQPLSAAPPRCPVGAILALVEEPDGVTELSVAINDARRRAEVTVG
jgi:hypothetical protein